MIKFNSKCFLKCFYSIKFLLNQDPCITREQSLSIHDVVNDQGFAMYYMAISNTVSHLEVFRCDRINTAKQKDGLTSFLMLNVLEAKIFQYDFLEGHNVWQNNRYWSSTQTNVVAIMATKPEFLVAKNEMLVALATVLVAFSSPGLWFLKYYAWLLSLQSCQRKGPISFWPFFLFSGGHL